MIKKFNSKREWLTNDDKFNREVGWRCLERKLLAWASTPVEVSGAWFQRTNNNVVNLAGIVQKISVRGVLPRWFCAILPCFCSVLHHGFCMLLLRYPRNPHLLFPHQWNVHLHDQIANLNISIIEPCMHVYGKLIIITCYEPVEDQNGSHGGVWWWVDQLADERNCCLQKVGTVRRKGGIGFVWVLGTPWESFCISSSCSSGFGLLLLIHEVCWWKWREPFWVGRANHIMGLRNLHCMRWKVHFCSQHLALEFCFCLLEMRACLHWVIKKNCVTT